MKKFIFLLPILLLLSTFSYAQINCGSEPSPQYIQELDNLIANKPGCVDDIEYNLDEEITFNLLLSYGKHGIGPGEFDDVALEEIEDYITNVYDPLNIKFNIMWHHLDCDECLDSYYDNESWPAFFDNSNCIQGHVVTLLANESVGGEAFGFAEGKFWAYPFNVPHELGHAMGLFHTHQPESGNDAYTSELVTRSIPYDSLNSCSCNCKFTGDRVCDTPADPWIVNPSTDEEEAHNAALFVGCEMDSTSMVVDSCGEQYTDLNQLSMKNVMSYHCPVGEDAILTDGQNNIIRMKLDNGNGTFNFQNDPTEMLLSQGLTANATMTLSTDEAFNGDIVVNSNLTIENCTIDLTQGHKIIVNAGANLTISNATIRTYTGSICYFQMGGKENWEGIEINLSASNFTSVSILAGSTINVSEAGIYTTENGGFGLLNLAINNSTVKGPAINIANSFGVQQLKKSHFDSTVEVTDCYYFGVEGCSFDFPDPSQSSGIKAYNTHLVVKAHLDGERSTFTNCGRGVEFISSSSQFCKIENTDFTNVLSGIHAESVAGLFDAHDCTISMRDPSGTQGFGRGIYLNNFMDFEIYNNNDIVGSGSGLQTGIDLDNIILNDNPNLIINNTIINCNNGINTFEAKLGNIMSGVEFECNTMIDIVNDNFVTNKVGPHQGRGVETGDARPAGNKFDGSPYCIATPDFCYSDFNYQGGGQDVTTYHYRDEGLENIEYYFDGSDLPGLEIFKVDKLENDESPQCIYPPLPNEPNPFPQVSTDRTKVLDGGHTDSIMIFIESDSDNAPTTVITTVIGNSPWVSVPVVQTLFDYSPYYTEQEIADVIIQNPGVLDDGYIYTIAL